MRHHTKNKADIAMTQVIADLTRKEFTVFSPVVAEHLPFDLIAYKNSKCYRIQVKYASDGNIKAKTSWADKNGTHEKFYQKDDFDYYAVYLPNIDEVVYPSIKFAGCRIASKIPNSATPFYWHEDFLELTDKAEKKNFKDFDFVITHKGKEQ